MVASIIFLTKMFWQRLREIHILSKDVTNTFLHAKKSCLFCTYKLFLVWILKCEKYWPHVVFAQPKTKSCKVK